MAENHKSLAQATFRRALPYAIDDRAFSPSSLTMAESHKSLAQGNCLKNILTTENAGFYSKKSID
jgi:hypothetical protein